MNKAKNRLQTIQPQPTVLMASFSEFVRVKSTQDSEPITSSSLRYLGCAPQEIMGGFFLHQFEIVSPSNCLESAAKLRSASGLL